MPLYNVEVTLKCTIVVQDDDEEDARQVAQESTREAIEDQRPDPSVSIRGEVTNARHLRDGWGETSLPYGGDGSARLSELLTQH